MSTQTDECDEFYRHHRGGQGAVIVVHSYDEMNRERIGIFSSIETAQAWTNALGDNWTSVFCPYIVDDPDWGNEADTARNAP